MIPTHHDPDSGSLTNPKMSNFLAILFYYKVMFIFYCLTSVFFCVNKNQNEEPQQNSQGYPQGLSAGLAHAVKN